MYRIPPFNKIKVSTWFCGLNNSLLQTAQNRAKFGVTWKMTWTPIPLNVWLETLFIPAKTTPKGFQKCKNVSHKLQCSLGNRMHKTGHFETSEPVCANFFFLQQKSHSLGLWSCSWTWWNILLMNMIWTGWVSINYELGREVWCLNEAKWVSN